MARYLVLDTETTGLDPKSDRVVEIAATLVAPEGVSVVVDHLVYPGRSIPPNASAVHHITDPMVASSPTLEEVWTTYVLPLLSTVDGIVAHNAAFDRPFLPPTDKPWICTLRLARHTWPEAPGHSNQVLRYWLGLDVDAPHPHRAADDTMVTAQIFLRLLPVIMAQSGLGDRLDALALAELANAPIKVSSMPFGKHKGTALDQVPHDYIRWALANMTALDADLRWSLSQEVEK